GAGGRACVAASAASHRLPAAAGPAAAGCRPGPRAWRRSGRTRRRTTSRSRLRRRDAWGAWGESTASSPRAILTPVLRRVLREIAASQLDTGETYGLFPTVRTC